MKLFPLLFEGLFRLKKADLRYENRSEALVLCLLSGLFEIWLHERLFLFFCATGRDNSRKNAKKIQEYIQRQLQEDALEDQMSLKEYIDPFTDEPVNKGNLLFASETIILANLLLAQFSSKNCRTSLQNCSGLSIKGVCPALSITTNFLEFAEILS